MPRWAVWNELKTSLLSLHTVIEHSDDLERLQRIGDKPVLLVKGKDSTPNNAGIVDLLANDFAKNSRVLICPMVTPVTQQQKTNLLALLSSSQHNLNIRNQLEISKGVLQVKSPTVDILQILHAPIWDPRTLVLVLMAVEFAASSFELKKLFCSKNEKVAL